MSCRGWLFVVSRVHCDEKCAAYRCIVGGRVERLEPRALTGIHMGNAAASRSEKQAATEKGEEDGGVMSDAASSPGERRSAIGDAASSPGGRRSVIDDEEYEAALKNYLQKHTDSSGQVKAAAADDDFNYLFYWALPGLASASSDASDAAAPVPSEYWATHKPYLIRRGSVDAHGAPVAPGLSQVRTYAHLVYQQATHPWLTHT